MNAANVLPTVRHYRIWKGNGGKQDGMKKMKKQKIDFSYFLTMYVNCDPWPEGDHME